MLERLKSIFREDSKYKPYLLSIFAMSLGYGLYKGVLDNYLSEFVNVNEMNRGVVEFFREMPGFALVFILALLITFSAEKLYKLGAVIMLVGMGMHAIVPANMVLITLSICMYSLGEHIQLGMKNTLSLEYSKEGRGGEALGYTGSSNQIGSLIGYLIIAATFIGVTQQFSYRIVFGVATVLTGIGVVCSFFLTGNSATDPTKRRFTFKKKFTKYYMLEVFYGARKQVFFTFGPYVLIRFYGAGATTISLLFAISAIACFFLSPVVGRIIDKVGYKIVMVMDTIILVAVCFFYGFAHRIFPMNVAFVICCVNYVLDSIISLASMASNVYVQDISSSPEEMRATISTGISVNHMITILIALFGGWIWQTLGMETLFILSAILGLCNSAYAATIKPSDKYVK